MHKGGRHGEAWLVMVLVCVCVRLAAEVLSGIVVCLSDWLSDYSVLFARWLGPADIICPEEQPALLLLLAGFSAC